MPGSDRPAPICSSWGRYEGRCDRRGQRAATALLVSISVTRRQLAEVGGTVDREKLLELAHGALDLAERAVSGHVTAMAALKAVLELDKAQETAEAVEEARRAGPVN